jgi:lipopolysaccharide export LptBFGC system permease protein LptF
MITLQWYISRELLKAFALTAIGLTLAFSLGGGILNMIQVEVLTAVQLGRILMFIIPVSATLTLPVAALFSTTIVYGRLSQDNEINACRAGGINIHWLLAPALALGIFTTAFTFVFSNFIIPQFIGGLEQLVRKDIEKIFVQTLRTQGHIEYGGKYVMHAESFKEYAGRPTPENPDGDREHYIELHRASFIELDHGELVQYGTAAKVLVKFENDPQGGDPVVQALMTEVESFDQERQQFYRLGEQRLGPFPIPRRFERKPKWMDLPELLYYLRQPVELPEIQKLMPRFRLQLQAFFFYQALIDGLKGPEHCYRFGTPERGYEIRARAISVDRETERPRLDEPVVRQWWNGLGRTYHAGSATLAVDRPFGEDVPHVYLSLGNDVTIVYDSEPDKQIAKTEYEPESVRLPSSVVQRATAITDADVFDVNKALGLSPRLERGRASLAEARVRLANHIVGLIHSRLAFSASVLVLVILGASLGIIFRGGQVLTAFVISFIPGLFVTVLNIMGRQMSEKEPIALIGLIVMWAALGVVALADAIVLKRFLRR